MAFQNLRSFVEALESRGELKRVKVQVDPYLEMTEIADRWAKQGGGPALLFEQVKGKKFPVLMNAFGSLNRMNFALGVESLDDVARRIEALFAEDVPKTFLDKIKKLPQLKEFAGFLPRRVSKAPCQEVIIKENPKLSLLPVQTCWPKDGGPFMTLPMVISQDPDTGIRNVGLYRMQIYDDVTTGLHWQTHKDGAVHRDKYLEKKKRIPVAVALGADPVTMYSATAPLPYGADEFLLSGFIRKEGVALVKCITSDLEVPAEAEFILEGWVDPAETRPEGPFGDHTGFYSPIWEYPVFHLECITHRVNPIYPGTIVGRPPMEDAFLGKATERIFLPFLRRILPEIVDMNLPVEGVFTNCAIVSIKKRYPGQGQKVIHALWGLGQMMFMKVIVIVEDDVNVQDLREVAWKVFGNLDPRRDLVIADGPLDDLDYGSCFNRFGSKLGIDATRKSVDEGMRRDWPDEIVMTPNVQSLVTRRWSEYGF